MSIKTRRILVCVGAITLLVGSVVPLFVGGQWLLAVADHVIPPGVPGQNLNTNERDAYLSFSFFGLVFATALSIVYCLGYRRATTTAVVAAYFAFLLVLTSTSAANFATGDMLLNRKAQALIDLILVILGSIVVVKLLKIRTTSTLGLALRGVIFFLIVLQGITLPAMHSVLWFLNWQNEITVTQSRKINPGWISAVAAATSVLIAILNYRSSQRSASKADGESLRIIS